MLWLNTKKEKVKDEVNLLIISHQKMKSSKLANHGLLFYHIKPFPTERKLQDYPLTSVLIETLGGSKRIFTTVPESQFNILTGWMILVPWTSEWKLIIIIIAYWITEKKMAVNLSTGVMLLVSGMDTHKW